MVDPWAVIDEEDEVVVCESFGSGGQLFGREFNFGVEFGEVDGVDVESVETGFCRGKTEKDGLRFRKPGRR
jgi:hypothetical protein